VPSTILKGHLARNNGQILGRVKAASYLIFALCLCSCLPERFRHEKYDCSASLQNIGTIILSKAKTGNHAKIASLRSETNATITQIDDQTAWVSYKDIKMKINRKTGTITLFQGTRYRKVVCKKTVFTM
jgi:hypothetical protein